MTQIISVFFFFNDWELYREEDTPMYPHIFFISFVTVNLMSGLKIFKSMITVIF